MLSKLALVFGPLALAVAVLGPLLARFNIIPPMVALGLVLLSGLLGFAGMAFGLTAAIRLQAYLPALVSVLGLLPFLVVVAMVAQMKRYPLINDITTDLSSPPVFRAAAALPGNGDSDMGFPPAFESVIQEHYGDLAPLKLDASADLVFQKAVALAVDPQFRWQITDEDSEDRHFEAVAETRVFRWQDDIVVVVTPEGDGCVVNMRSKSRDGQGDFGANARRIRRFFEVLETL